MSTKMKMENLDQKTGIYRISSPHIDEYISEKSDDNGKSPAKQIQNAPRSDGHVQVDHPTS